MNDDNNMSSTGDYTITISSSDNPCTTIDITEIGNIIDLDNASTYIDTSTLGVDFNITSDTITYVDVLEMDDRLKRIEAMIAEEAEIRSKHPAVKQAYDEYKLLLELAKPNAGDQLTNE